MNTAHKLKISTSGQVPLTMALAKSEIYTLYVYNIYIYNIWHLMVRSLNTTPDTRPIIKKSCQIVDESFNSPWATCQELTWDLEVLHLKSCNVLSILSIPTIYVSLSLSLSGMAPCRLTYTTMTRWPLDSPFRFNEHFLEWMIWCKQTVEICCPWLRSSGLSTASKDPYLP